MTPDSTHFHRGRWARSQGEPRVIRDGRMSPKSRQDWYAGWDHEDRLRQPPQTPEQSAETDEALAGIREFLEANNYRRTS